MKILLDLALKTRALVNRFLFPPKIYMLKPASIKYGLDRGKPIDRYYIEKFLIENKMLIKGRGLEITDGSYLKKFGENRVKRIDVLDIDTRNQKANIYGDLKNLKSLIMDNQYDVIILTQVLGMIDDTKAVLSECYRILKPGGWLIGTTSHLAACQDLRNSYWRFTTASISYLIGKFFEPKKTSISSYGNVLVGQAFWLGLAQEDLKKEDFEKNDPRYPLIIAFKAQK